MAIGDKTPSATGDAVEVELLAATAATNVAPSLVTDGLATSTLKIFGPMPDEVELLVWNTAGSGAVSALCRIWGYSAGMGWAPVGTGSDSMKGIINEGSSIGETGTDLVKHAERFRKPGSFERLYLEILAINGTFKAALRVRCD